jgi:hypothetical protein
MLAMALPPTCRAAAKVNRDPRQPVPEGIRVILQLAGRSDRDERRLAGCLCASIGSPTSREPPYAGVALIHLEGSIGRPRLGDVTFPKAVSLATEVRLRSAIDHAWRTAMNVDLVDEQGRPLLLGALKPHPAGVSRWLMQYFQDGR